MSIKYGMEQDYKDMLRSDISEIETAASQYVIARIAASAQANMQSQYNYSCDIFISYSSQDQARANEIYKSIIEEGGKAFLSSKSLNPGDDFAEEIRNQLNTSRELWLVLSPNSLKSEWVLTEWGAAWASKKKIVPIIYRCRPEELPERLKKIHCIDFHDYPELVRKTFSAA